MCLCLITWGVVKTGLSSGDSLLRRTLRIKCFLALFYGPIYCTPTARRSSYLSGTVQLVPCTFRRSPWRKASPDESTSRCVFQSQDKWAWPWSLEVERIFFRWNIFYQFSHNDLAIFLTNVFFFAVEIYQKDEMICVLVRSNYFYHWSPSQDEEYILSRCHSWTFPQEPCRPWSQCWFSGFRRISPLKTASSRGSPPPARCPPRTCPQWSSPIG